MPEYQNRITRCCCHYKNKNNIINLFNSISYCIICSSFIIKNISSFQLSPKVIKPNNFKLNKEDLHNLDWLTKESHPHELFNNQKEYLKLRAPIVRNIKKICTDFCLSLKTYFSSIEYLDIICSKIFSYHNNTLIQLSLFCIILASKFFENKNKAFEVQSFLKQNVSKNYSFDEIYVLKLLNYDLNIESPYDMLIDILYYGFVFENEDFNPNNLDALYKNILKMLYIFSESNSYIKMTPKQIAIGMMCFCRELLNLNPFSEEIKKIFLANKTDNSLYVDGLNIIKKRIKIENERKIGNNISKKCDENQKHKDFRCC